ncbi:MAG: hypothetical protein ACXW6J_27875 [Candidatus Binatia bacterium]
MLVGNERSDCRVVGEVGTAPGRGLSISNGKLKPEYIGTLSAKTAQAKKGDQPVAPTNPIPFCELCVICG